MHRITLAGDRPRQQARLLTLIEWQAALPMADRCGYEITGERRFADGVRIQQRYIGADGGRILCRRTQAIHMTVDKTTRNTQCACRL